MSEQGDPQAYVASSRGRTQTTRVVGLEESDGVSLLSDDGRGTSITVLVEVWSADLRMGATNDPLDLAAYSSRQELHVVICGPDSSELRRRAEESGATFVAHSSAAFSRSSVLKFAMRVVSGIRLLRSHRPDIVHLNYASWGPSLAYAAWLLGIPVVARAGPFDDRNPANRWIRGYLAISEHQAKAMAATAETARLDVVGPFISMERLKQADTPDPLPPRLGSGCRFLFLGQLVPRKGIEVLLRALAETGDDTELLLVGGAWSDPGHPRELVALISSLGLEGRVVTLDHRTDVGRLLRDADALVLPSLSEAIPRCVLEALVVGTPVVATRVGGLPTVVQHEVTGLLVEPGDVGGLAEALRRVAADRVLRSRLSQHARAWAAREIEPRVTAGRYLHAYRAAMAPGGAVTPESAPRVR